MILGEGEEEQEEEEGEGRGAEQRAGGREAVRIWGGIGANWPQSTAIGPNQPQIGPNRPPSCRQRLGLIGVNSG